MKVARIDHFKIANKLRAKPDTWFRVGAYNSPTSAKECVWGIKTGRRSYGPAGAFEAEVRKDNTVYARFVGAATVPRSYDDVPPPAEEKPKRRKASKAHTKRTVEANANRLRQSIAEGEEEIQRGRLGKPAQAYLNARPRKETSATTTAADALKAARDKLFEDTAHAVTVYVYVTVQVADLHKGDVIAGPFGDMIVDMAEPYGGGPRWRVKFKDLSGQVLLPRDARLPIKRAVK